MSEPGSEQQQQQQQQQQRLPPPQRLPAQLLRSQRRRTVVRRARKGMVRNEYISVRLLENVQHKAHALPMKYCEVKAQSSMPKWTHTPAS
eukprot:1161733-Pelagomonas_calceolata.AAC.6